jgi:hypothetical protein
LAGSHPDLQVLCSLFLHNINTKLNAQAATIAVIIIMISSHINQYSHSHSHSLLKNSMVMRKILVLHVAASSTKTDIVPIFVLDKKKKY